MRNLPNAITISGGAIGLLGCALYPSRVGIALLCLSIAFDIIDGYVARCYHLVTEFGSVLDWWSDVLVANFLVYSMAINGYLLSSAIALGAMLMCQMASPYSFHRSSGRALVTLIAMLVIHG